MLDMAAANDKAAAEKALQAAAAADAAGIAATLTAASAPRACSPSTDSSWRRVSIHRRSPSPQSASFDRRKLLSSTNSSTLLPGNHQPPFPSLHHPTPTLHPHPQNLPQSHHESLHTHQSTSPHMIPDPASLHVPPPESTRAFVVSPYIAAMQGAHSSSQPFRDPSTQSPAATPILATTDLNLRLPIGHGLTLGPRLTMRHLSHHKQLAGVSSQIQEMVVCAELGASGEEKLGSGRVVVKGNDVAMSSAQGKSRKVELVSHLVLMDGCQCGQAHQVWC